MSHIAHELTQKHAELEKRNHRADEDPVIGFQAEYNMIRIERMIDHGGQTGFCATCGEEIPRERLIACPESIWCVNCVEEYEERKKKPWKTNSRYGKSY